jgi:transcriptional regulator of acetoin/glycerol metabolism
MRWLSWGFMPGASTGMSVPGGVKISTEASGGSDRLRRAEIEMTKKTLIDCRGNKTEAAKALGIARSTLFRKLKEFGIEDEIPDPEGA